MEKVEGMLSAGKQAALKAIDRLETNAREMRAEAAMLREEDHADHEAKMATLNGEVRLHAMIVTHFFFLVNRCFHACLRACLHACMLPCFLQNVHCCMSSSVSVVFFLLGPECFA